MTELSYSVNVEIYVIDFIPFLSTEFTEPPNQSVQVPEYRLVDVLTEVKLKIFTILQESKC